MTVAQLPTVEGEKTEREMSYCSSTLFFCFSVLSFYSLVSSSLPLSVRLPCFQNNLCSSLKQSPASFSLFGSLLQVRFPKVLPPLFSFFFPSSSPFLQLASFFSPKKISPPRPPHLLSLYTSQYL
ncbi:hypothetical protein POPTR_004G056250v4 [Populus trichocarpa]|uniref:Transmembrane protein n=1 Tax=Populus trichocarpa TaxID=3694 RepID=A0A3N7ERV4_POPTR|nr:hypothetical protein BDE02_04G048800 [Populus trichocarpa]RQO88986.1 hypothetical protein POPTR_004G056250v4 [Populus trichocarpa]